MIKAIDEESGAIVGFAKWIVYPEEEDLLGEEGGGEKKEDGGWRHNKGEGEVTLKPEGIDERALRAWNNVIARTRKNIMGSRTHACKSEGECSLACYFASIAPAIWVLDIIHVHPAHQQHGVGTLLLRWGTDLADRMDMSCYVETSLVGHSLFRKYDFEDVREMEIDLNKYKKHQYYYDQNYQHTVMVRHPSTPPKVPPKDLNVVKQIEQREGDLILLESQSHPSLGSAYGVRRKPSLIEIKRSPRLDRSPRPDGSNSSRKSDSVPSIKGQEMENPSLDQSPRPENTDLSKPAGSVPSLTGREMENPSPGPIEQIIESYSSRDT